MVSPSDLHLARWNKLLSTSFLSTVASHSPVILIAFPLSFSVVFIFVVSPPSKHQWPKLDPECHGGTNGNYIKVPWSTRVSSGTCNMNSEDYRNTDSWHFESTQSLELNFLVLTLMSAEQWPISHWYFPWPPASTLHCPLLVEYSNNAGMRSNRSPTAFRNWTSKTLRGWRKREETTTNTFRQKQQSIETQLLRTFSFSKQSFILSAKHLLTRPKC